MDKINEALQRIYAALDSVEEIAKSACDWKLIFECCQGAEGFVYYGKSDSEIGIYKVLNAYSEQYLQSYGYISGT